MGRTKIRQKRAKSNDKGAINESASEEILSCDRAAILNEAQIDEHNSKGLSSDEPSISISQTRAEADGLSQLRVSLLIGLFCFLLYNANWRVIGAGDTYPARYLPFAILQHHTLLLDPIEKVAAQGRGDNAYWMVSLPDGHIISMYPIVVPIFVSPLYIPAVAYLHMQGYTDIQIDRAARIMEKLSAALIASFSAALLYLLLLRRANASTALLLTLAYAFGTTSWVISSQALWQHGMAQLLVIGTLLLLTGPCTLLRAVVAGLLCGLIVGNRPPDAILAAALGVYGLFWAGRYRAVLIVAAVLPVSLVLFYNLYMTGNIAGGYGLRGKAEFFHHDLISGIGGLLFSPTHGLFIFSPFLLFLLLIWRHLPRDRGDRLLTLAMGIAVTLQMLLYAKADWRAGLCWGPRFLTDLLPFLIWMLVPVVAALRGVAKAGFLFAVVLSVIIEAIGAFYYTDEVGVPLFADNGPSEMQAAWDWQNAPFIASLQKGLMPSELMTVMRGSFDAIEDVGGPTSVVTIGDEVVATGWALAGHVTPTQVAITIDGQQTSNSHTFYDRPDLRDSLGVASPAGWRIPFDTSNLTPGNHQIAVLVWASDRSPYYYLAERTLTVQEPSADTDLQRNSRKATAQLRNHQQAQGYWLTAYTNELRFNEPHPEMNTFLTALLLELLNPVAATSGLEENLKRARQHLTSQIESNGLVRYHGLPNSPIMGTLGCAITPDTDDTALVWRLAPGPDRSQLKTALETIEQYRTREGLYRTWLSPPEAYQCLNPGSDANPTDIVIQMHLLLLLSEVQPSAGRALCQALNSVVDQDRVWVYYRKTPLIPMLRMADLHRTGCELKLPESRMNTDIPGQQIWSSVVRLLESGDVKGSSPDQVRVMLRELAKDDFALLRSNPPLLYHNDLTATVPRYYWSEDIGYALWLRIYNQYVHNAPSHLNR